MVEPEVGTAHGEYEPVGLEDLAPAGESHVAQLLGPAKILLKYHLLSRAACWSPESERAFIRLIFFIKNLDELGNFKKKKILLVDQIMKTHNIKFDI